DRRGRAAHRRLLDRRRPGDRPDRARPLTAARSKYTRAMAPLDGIRVIDLTRVVAGPFCTMMLGDLGAEVLKIEEPEHGDDRRGWGPYINGQGAFYLGLNRSKKSVALDLKTAEGAGALKALVASADILIENFRPGSLAQLGFGYADVAAMNPRIIY